MYRQKCCRTKTTLTLFINSERTDETQQRINFKSSLRRRNDKKIVFDNREFVGQQEKKRLGKKQEIPHYKSKM